MKRILFLMLILASFTNAQWDTPFNTDTNYRSSSIVIYNSITGKYYNPAVDSNGVITVKISGATSDTSGLRVLRVDSVVDTSTNADRNLTLNAVQYHYTATQLETKTNLDTDSTQWIFDLQSYRNFSFAVFKNIK